MTLNDIFDEVLEIVSRLGAGISGDVEAFLAAEIEKISGSRQEIIAMIAEYAPNWFRSVGATPAWIQEADWPVYEGQPMLFIGQIDLPKALGEFHDDAGVFVFATGDFGVTKTVIQVA